MARVNPRLITLEVDGVDRSDEISSGIIKSAKAARDFMSYAEARGAGARDRTLELTIAQDPAAGTLYNLVLTAPGTLVTGTYTLFGNEDPSVAQPHGTFEAKIMEPDGDYFGAPATDDVNAVATIDVSWPITAWTLDTTP